MKTYIFSRQSLIALLFLVLFCLPDHAQTVFYNPQILPPKHEVRAVWLTTIGGLDWPHSYAQSERSANKQKKELCDILDRLQEAGINTVLLQARVRATTIYPSAIEPWDGCLSGFPGRSPGYDALAFAIDECHKRGMELHAWVVTMPVGKWNGPGCTALRKTQPTLLKRIGQEGYMNPENPQTAPYLARICQEIVHNYDVDGIHLDYIRYPETWNIKVSRPQGRAYITEIVRQIHDVVKKEKPWVKMSCSPIGKHDDLARYWSHGWNARTTVCQDAQNWLKEGLMDELFPMMYFKDNNFFPFAIDWKEQSHGRIVVPGLGIYFMHPKEKDWPLESITREMEVSRQYGMGHAFFRSKFFTDNVKGIYDFTARTFNLYPALIPAMTWERHELPDAPQGLDIQSTSQQTTLSWTAPQNHSGAPYLLYNVYASRQYPVDINDARNLIVPRTMDTHQQLNTIDGMHYAVTTLDRYGNESKALQEAEGQNAVHRQLWLKNDGNKLLLPKTSAALDAEYIVIEDLPGRIVTTLRYSSRVDISHIAEGIYLLRSINHKGIQHRLGAFIIKRKG